MVPILFRPQFELFNANSVIPGAAVLPLAAPVVAPLQTLAESGLAVT